MNKTLLLLILCLSVNLTKATTIVPNDNIPANLILVTLPGTNIKVNLPEFIKLTPQKYKELTGKKLSFGGKIELKLKQNYGRKLIKKDGKVDTERLKKRYGFFDRWSWHWGGFALGFLLILGPIISLFFTDEYKWDRFWTSLIVATALMSGLVAVLTSGL